MSGFVEMMAAPVVMALILVAMHSHLGWHVVRRGVIFVDIALAQTAAFGVAIALLLGGEIGPDGTYVVALLATYLGAVLIAATRTRDTRVPQEAYIGIIYAVASAAMILVLTQVPHGGEEIRHLLVGAILWVTWPIVLKTAILYGALGGLLWLWRKPLRRISTDHEKARAEGLRVGVFAKLDCNRGQEDSAGRRFMRFAFFVVDKPLCIWIRVCSFLEAFRKGNRILRKGRIGSQ